MSGGNRAMRILLDMQCPKDFGTEPDCACPYEHWHIGVAGCCLDIHVEEEGYTHIILGTGDDEFEHTLPGVTCLETARPLAMAWAAEMICEVRP